MLIQISRKYFDRYVFFVVTHGLYLHYLVDTVDTTCILVIVSTFKIFSSKYISRGITALVLLSPNFENCDLSLGRLAPN